MNMRVIGIDELRPRLGAVLDEIERSGEPVVITSRSKPRGVLISYDRYRNMSAAVERAQRAWLLATIERFQDRAASAGLTEEDARREIEAGRRARRR
jgi:prevent-host-death family protein